jgi:hypothetical protein
MKRPGTFRNGKWMDDLKRLQNHVHVYASKTKESLYQIREKSLKRKNISRIKVGSFYLKWMKYLVHFKKT